MASKAEGQLARRPLAQIEKRLRPAFQRVFGLSAFGFRVLGFRVFGFRVLGFRVFGFRVLGFRVFGFRV